MLVHLDTDLGTDPDDVCALTMLLGLEGVDVVGVTTSADPGGRRAGYVAHCLGLLGRKDIPLVAGAEGSLSHSEPPVVATGCRYWPPGIVSLPAPPGAAHPLLLDSVERGPSWWPSGRTPTSPRSNEITRARWLVRVWW